MGRRLVQQKRRPKWAQRCSTKTSSKKKQTLPSPALHARRPSPPPPPPMDAGECSTSKPPQPCSPSASSPAGAAVWAKLGDRPPRSGSLRVPSPARFLDSSVLFSWARPPFPAVPADSAFPEVEIAEDDAVVCSLVSPTGGEELAWCEIRRGGDASSATIRNLRYFRLVDSCRIRGVRIAGKDAFFRWFDGLSAVSCPVRLVAAEC